MHQIAYLPHRDADGSARESQDMKIAGVKTHVLSTPLEEPFAFSMGRVTKRSTMVVEAVGALPIAAARSCMVAPRVVWRKNA